MRFMMSGRHALIALVPNVVLLAIAIGAPPAIAAPVIDTVSVTPASVPVGVATPVLVTAAIADLNVLPGGVNLQRLDSQGRIVAIVGILHDDGVNGDAVAGDRVFSLRVSVAEPVAGPVAFRVSAAFRATLKRALSPLLTVDVRPSVVLSSIEVTPTDVGVALNTIIGAATLQLRVTGHFTDGTTADLTSAGLGTTYASNNLVVCDMGAPDGTVVALAAGACTIAVSNGGFNAEARATIQTFSPTPLSQVAIPGFPNNVAVNGGYAFVAAGSTGLQVVSITNPNSPVIVAGRDTPGNANDVTVVGNTAYVADGVAGLQIIDITVPTQPVIVGSLDTPGDASDVAVWRDVAYVADGFAGLRIIDVSVPTAPRLLGSIDPPGQQKGVAVDPVRHLAVLASGISGLHVIDVSDPVAPVQRGALFLPQNVRDLTLVGTRAMVAGNEAFGGLGGFTSVDLADPDNPIVSDRVLPPPGGQLNDIAAQGRFGFAADYFFINTVPIFDLTDPAHPIRRAQIDFSPFGDSDGQGIAVDGAFVYLTAVLGSAFIENGSIGNGRLYIGAYLVRQDRGGRPPTAAVTFPAAGTTVAAGTRIVGSSRVDLQACKLEYSIVSPK